MNRNDRKKLRHGGPGHRGRLTIYAARHRARKGTACVQCGRRLRLCGDACHVHKKFEE